MEIEITTLSQLPSEQNARLNFSFFPTSDDEVVGRRMELLQGARFVLRDDGIFGQSPWKFTLRAEFRNEERDRAEASVWISPSLIEGINIIQLGRDYIVANIRHGHTRSDIVTDQCTVECPRTGEKRSGRNVCIECTTKKGTIKICC